ncbi:hypothetical protein [Streptomyces sp. TRM68367]|uniref:hypothetical protein n=1 Tax=Streptomyces sp. TRM68367 TaxID=2758415 RepID=UPI00165A4BBF|nr:hypothetical protein [Streptomyces sp. TRM68367]MBC9730156.1 hypothetical protein [Streptomyces sp. TRM68367]
MPSTHPSVTILNEATALVRRRAARLGTEPVPAPPVTVVLDEAATLLTDPSSPAHDLVADLLTRGRAVGVRVVSRSNRQYATLSELDAAAEHGDL